MVLPWLSRDKSLFQQFIDLVTEASGLIECVITLGGTKPDGFDCRSYAEATDRLLSKLLGLIRRMKQWRCSSNIKMPVGPATFTVDSNQLSRASQKRSRLRGYSNKIGCSIAKDFSQLQAARLLHIYWTTLLELYTAILESAPLISRLTTTSQELSGGSGLYPAEDKIRAECRCLADDISLWSEFCSQNVWQSFGAMSKSFLHFQQSLAIPGNY